MLLVAIIINFKKRWTGLFTSVCFSFLSYVYSSYFIDNLFTTIPFFCLFCFVFVFVFVCFVLFLFCVFLLRWHAPVNRQVFEVVTVMTWTENWLKALRWLWVLKDFLCCYQPNSSTGRCCFIYELQLSLLDCTSTQTHQLSLQWRTATEPWPLLSLLLKSSSWFVTGTWMAKCSVLELGFKVRASISYHTYYLPCRFCIKPSRAMFYMLGVLYGENALK